MSTPKSSPTARRDLDKITDGRRIVSEGDAPPLTNKTDKPSSSPANNPTDNIYCSAEAGSTPHPDKCPPKREAYDTPPYTDSSGDRSFTTPSTVPGSNSSMEIFLGPQPLSFVHNRQRVLVNNFDLTPSPPSTDVAAKVASATVGIGALHVGNDAPQPLLSKWRRDQLKKFKQGRPMPNTRERPLPILHGPLSLPYAHATLADQNAHMSHVFGLRSSDAAEGKANKASAPRARIPSDSTTRTVSGGSSLMSLEGQSDYPSSISSFGSMKRPHVIRDVNQLIGIKKDMQNPELLVPPTEPHKIGRDIRTQLGLGKPLPTIPDYAQGFIPATPDYAVHAAGGSVWPTNEHQYHADYATVALVDPMTNTVYNVKVPKAAHAGATGGLACEILSTGNKVPSVHQNYSSKADTSANWRARHNVFASHSPAPLAPPPPSLAGSPAPQGYGASGDVLTVENLYEKFGSRKGDKNKNDANPPKPKKSDKHKSGSSKTLGDSTGRQVNIQADETLSRKGSKKKLRPATNKNRSVSAPALNPKGTPGAGRHLRATATPTEED